MKEKRVVFQNKRVLRELFARINSFKDFILYYILYRSVRNKNYIQFCKYLPPNKIESPIGIVLN